MPNCEAHEIPIELGIVVPPLAEQLAAFDLKEKEVARLQGLNDAISRLYLSGYIPDSQTEKLRKKLVKEIEGVIIARGKQ